MRAAFYECDITPPLGGYMWGYYCRRFADDVTNRLYARAVVTEDNGNVAAIVSIDTCTIPPEMHDIVTKRIYEYTGIAPECVCITSNHTHRGAPVSDSPELNAYADKPYTDVFYRLCADAIILAYKRLSDASIYFSSDELYGISHNRISVCKDGIYRTNNFAPNRISALAGIDPALSVMRIDIDGKPAGAIVNFALHQDTASPVTGYSGDYASIISEKLKEIFGQKFVTVFVLGTCGDINHFNYEEKSKNIQKDYEYWELGAKLAHAAADIMEKAAPVSSGISCSKETLTVKKRLTNNADTIAAIKKLSENNMHFFNIRNIIYYNSSNIGNTYDILLQVLRIGDVCIYCLPGEIFVNYGLSIKKASPFSKNIVIENCNSYLGYVPSPEAFDACSLAYEIQLCQHSCLVPEAGQIIVDKVLDMAKGLS